MSMNGTFVNDERVGKGNKVVLKHGDKICLVKPKNSEGVLGFYYYELSDWAHRSIDFIELLNM